MAVWIFIFLTLLYMILLICEGTRGNGKKKANAAGQPVAYSCFPDNVRVMCAAGIYGEEEFHGILEKCRMES